MNAHNTFENPDKVKPAAFDGVKLTAEGVSFTIPPKSVMHISLRP
jgi:alpha-N-arabinofuranosidase